MVKKLAMLDVGMRESRETMKLSWGVWRFYVRH